MIYHYATKTIILTPPKTASSSLHQSLCRRQGFYYVLSLASWNRVSKHCSVDELGHEPPEFASVVDRRLLLTVRHPVDRLISMYRHHLSYGEFSGSLQQWVQHHDRSGGENWLRSCHAHLCGREPRGVIRTESLDQDLLRLGLPPVGIRIHQTRQQTPVDRELARRVALRWWPDDFQYYKSVTETASQSPIQR